MACGRLIITYLFFFSFLSTVAGEFWEIVSLFRLSSPAWTRRFGFKTGVRFIVFLQLINKFMASLDPQRSSKLSQEALVRDSCRTECHPKAWILCKKEEKKDKLLLVFLCADEALKLSMKSPEIRVAASNLRNLSLMLCCFSTTL